MDTTSNSIAITTGPFRFVARLEESAAPRTCAAFRTLLPLRATILQARWSGEAAWVPLGDPTFELAAENATSKPDAGQLLFYPGGVSEVEILFPYGRTRFGCRNGELEGNHFLTITDGAEQLHALGELVVQRGAQDVTFEQL